MQPTPKLIIKKEWFIQRNERDIKDCYKFNKNDDLIGQGQFGEVVKATQVGTGITRAIKIIKKKKITDSDRLVQQVNILKGLDHPNVVRLYEIFQTEKQLYLVMEYCHGGQVWNYDAALDELAASRIIRDVAEAINYCHNHKVCHRDLKPDNLVYSDESKKVVKVIDFGLSAKFDRRQRMKTMAGSCYFMSPEVINRQYDESCDIWSLGVLLYCLLCAEPPFYGQSQVEIFQRVKKLEYDLEGNWSPYAASQFENISPEAKDLIRRCLQTSSKRITPGEILKHPWFERLQESKSYMTGTTASRAKNKNEFQITVLSYMASQLTSEEAELATNLFRSHDKNKDGYLQYSEVEEILMETGTVSKAEATKIAEQFDTDKDGKLGYNEFLALMIKPDVYTNNERIRKAFELFDKDHKGEITMEDFRRVAKDSYMSLSKWNKVVGTNQQRMTESNFRKVLKK